MRIKEFIKKLKEWFKFLFRLVAKTFKFVFDSIISGPLRYALISFLFISFILGLLSIFNFLSPFKLYVSMRDSIVEIGRAVHIVIKKDNELVLYMGHSDSSKGLKEDNYEIEPNSQNISSLYFAIENPNEEDTYKSVRLFLQFLDEDKKVDGKDGGFGGWTKFKDNNFNYRLKGTILQHMTVQLNLLHLKFPKKGKYIFSYSLYADGYKPKNGLKTIIVK